MTQTEEAAPTSARRVPIRWSSPADFPVTVRNRCFVVAKTVAATKLMSAKVRSLAIVSCGLLLAGWLTGCSAPAVRQQRWVAQANMTFGDSAAFQYNSSRLLSQAATGLAGATGPQNSGCTSCR